MCSTTLLTLFCYEYHQHQRLLLFNVRHMTKLTHALPVFHCYARNLAVYVQERWERVEPGHEADNDLGPSGDSLNDPSNEPVLGDRSDRDKLVSTCT